MSSPWVVSYTIQRCKGAKEKIHSRPLSLCFFSQPCHIHDLYALRKHIGLCGYIGECVVLLYPEPPPPPTIYLWRCRRRHQRRRHQTTSKVLLSIGVHSNRFECWQKKSEKHYTPEFMCVCVVNVSSVINACVRDQRSGSRRRRCHLNTFPATLAGSVPFCVGKRQPFAVRNGNFFKLKIIWCIHVRDTEFS